MLIGIIINFSVMFTFIIFSYFIYEYFQEKRTTYIEFQPFIIAIAATTISLFLMKTAVPFDSGLIGDNRNISILLAGLLGGPYAILIASILVGIFRIVLFDLTTISIISGINLIFIGLLLFLVSRKIPITIKNIHYFLLFQTFEIAVVLFFIQPDYSEAYKVVLFFSASNLIGFYITFIFIKLFHLQFERIRMIERIAKTDYLTDLPNIRNFHEKFEVALQTEKEFSILLIDIDDFKTINRRYGHTFGDELLQLLASRLNNFASANHAFPARVGGEEFYFLCYDAPPATGITLASEILSLIRHEPFTLSDGKEVSLSVSIGVASFPDNGMTVQSISHAVDQAAVTASHKDNSLIKIVHANQIDEESKV